MIVRNWGKTGKEGLKSYAKKENGGKRIYICGFAKSLMLGYFRRLFRVNMPQKSVTQEAYAQINKSLHKAFEQPSLRSYLRTLPTPALLTKAVQMFVGSRTIPKNIQLSNYLIQVARQKATTQAQRDEIDYYKYFFIRIDALKTGKKQEFDMTTEAINTLAEERQHPQSSYLAGKQIYDISLTVDDPEQKREILQMATNYFERSLTHRQNAGLFYLGQIFKKEQISTLPEQQVRRFYVYGAALGDPLCYFQMYKHYISEEKTQLALKYLIMAAESGVVQAQHNLACCYLFGQNFPKDEVKAMAWFLQASANGFVESKFNIVYLFLNGSECGRIKKNPKAALLKLQQLRDSGEEVEEKIKQILETEEMKKLIGPQSSE